MNALTSSGRGRRLAHGLLALGLALAGTAALVPDPESAEAATSSAVTMTSTPSRTFVDADGTRTTVGSDTVTLTVDQTTHLRGRQEIKVSWSGAHPTGAVVPDPHASEARNQEYPFVLLQCRGVDTTGAVPRGQARLGPETCWTQTSAERYLAAASHTPSWRFDAHATADERRAVVGAPDPLPAACEPVSQPLSARWLPFRAEDGTVYHGGPDPDQGCTGLPPESDSAEAGGLPSNTTYAATGKDGRGQTDFAVWTKGENASLGCSPTVQCALVAIPVVGISCDAFGTTLPAGTHQKTRAGAPLTEAQVTTADTTCRRTGAYEPGSTRASETTDQAVRGSLWWSASNWHNRITVPLTFAETGSVCDSSDGGAPEQFMGSVTMNELTASWRPTFCTTPSLFSFTHVQQSDALARDLVESGAVGAAFTTAGQEGGYSSPVVQAPTAFTGFAISFTIDDAEGRKVEDLRLNARLVAKLLTTSYPAMAVVRDNHPTIGGNPLNITLDPEFQALNPGLPHTSTLEAAAALQVFSVNSDMIWALTSWLDADDEARAWLDGRADPWGTVVNGSYKGVDLPLDNWPLLDDFVAPEYYQAQNACYDNSPTPMMQLLSNPLANLGTVVLNMQYANSAVSTVCKFDGYDRTTLPLRQQGRQTVGYRFVLGVTSVSAARRYNLRAASLQSSSTVPASERFTSAAGRTFARPDAAGLRAAAGLLVEDPTQQAWRLDHQALGTTAAAAAYPGAMPVYTVVRTDGLSATSAGRLASFLCYAHGRGQASGTANGTLPDGYLPLTEANGLGVQRERLLTAALAVRAQQGATPTLDEEAPSRAAACGTGRPGTPPTKGEPTPEVEVTTLPVDDVPALPAEVPAGDEVAEIPTPDADATFTDEVALTAGMDSTFGRLGPTGLLWLALLSGVLGALLRFSSALTGAAARTRAGWVGGGRPRGSAGTRGDR